MKLYCNIKKITSEEETETFVINEGPMELPECTSTISNLRCFNEEELKTLGWVPVVEQTENKPIVVAVNYEVFEDKVIKHIITRDKTEQELAQEKEKQDYYTWQEIRKQRNDLLTESDKLVMIDRWENLSAKEKQNIAVYRQALRDLPDQNSDPNLLIFPTL